MTPRKELYLVIQSALSTIQELEYIELYRKQFDAMETTPCWTAALVRINRIAWESMVEGRQEGRADVDILLYTKDGWMDQFFGSADPQNGLAEIDLIDRVASVLSGVFGESFKPLDQASEDVEDNSFQGVMSYRINFTTLIYRTLIPKYENKKFNLNP